MDWERPQDSRYWPAVGQMMIRLDILSDAPTTHEGVAKGFGGSKPESKPPTGPKAPKGDSCPSPNENLYEFYRWHFLRAQTDKRILDLLAEAEHDYHEYRGTAPKPRGKDGPESEPEFQERVVAMYEGVDADRVARFESCRVAVVYKARKVKKRDQEKGHPRRWEPSWPDKKKREVIAKLAEKGLTRPQVESELGIKSRTVQTFWPREA